MPESKDVAPSTSGGSGSASHSAAAAARARFPAAWPPPAEGVLGSILKGGLVAGGKGSSKRSADEARNAEVAIWHFPPGWTTQANKQRVYEYVWGSSAAGPAAVLLEQDGDVGAPADSGLLCQRAMNSALFVIDLDAMGRGRSLGTEVCESSVENVPAYAITAVALPATWDRMNVADGKQRLRVRHVRRTVKYISSRGPHGYLTSWADCLAPDYPALMVSIALMNPGRRIGFHVTRAHALPAVGAAAEMKVANSRLNPVPLPASVLPFVPPPPPSAALVAAVQGIEARHREILDLEAEVNRLSDIITDAAVVVDRGGDDVPAAANRLMMATERMKQVEALLRDLP